MEGNGRSVLPPFFTCVELNGALGQPGTICRYFCNEQVGLNIFYFQEGKWDWTSKDAINVLSLHKTSFDRPHLCTDILPMI